MKLRPALLAIAIVATLGLSACKREDAATPGASAVPAGETADQFIARVNTEFRKSYSELTSAQWLSSTYINSDTEALAAKAKAVSIYTAQKFSDHAPLVVDYGFTL